MYAHGGSHAQTAGPPDVLPPGYGELEFPAPIVGSYALPPLRAAADGDVLTAEGRATTLFETFGDRIVLLSFVYASCPDVAGCPLATAVLHRVQRRLRDEPALHDQLQLVSLSFDPVRDTPEAMARYGAGFRDAAVDWSFLTTASERALAPTLAAYGQTVQREYGPDGAYLGTLSHVLRVFLIDRERRIRNVYSVSFLHPDTLIADVKTLLLEAPAPRDAAVPGRAGLLGPRDVRDGYERADFATRSVRVDVRAGERTDLLARLERGVLGLPPVPVPEDNPLSRAGIELGRKLFFDRRLSLNDTVSCAMCHIPEQGFASNELATAVGLEGRTVRRNAPTIYNVAYHDRLFHDGRETRLEHQVWGPLLASNEMGNPSIGALLEKLRLLDDYEERFETAFPGRGIRMETLGAALASYERVLVSGGSAFDRWRYGEEEDALDASARRGFELFAGNAGCVTCHPIGTEHALFADGAFHNTGVGYRATMGEPAAETQELQIAPGVVIDVAREIVRSVAEPRPVDLGRYEITQDPDDRWRYRTPTLRNVALTAPYMHDGSLGTLRDVVAFYDRGGVANPLLDPAIHPLGLSASEIDDLVDFLRALTGGDVELLVRDAFAAPIGDVGAVMDRAQ